MRCRLCTFGNWGPRVPALSFSAPTLTQPHGPRCWGGRAGRPTSPPGSGAPPPCSADAVRGPRRLMRVGLALILVGHVNLLLGAVLHGTVLRHVANPRGAVTPEYTAANVISVGSGLLVSAAAAGRGPAAPGEHSASRGLCVFQSVSLGLVALVASRNLLQPRLVRVVSGVLTRGLESGQWG